MAPFRKREAQRHLSRGGVDGEPHAGAQDWGVDLREELEEQGIAIRVVKVVDRLRIATKVARPEPLAMIQG